MASEPNIGFHEAECGLLALEEGLKKIDVEIDGIENSEFCKKLKASIESRYESLPDKVKKMLGTVGSWSKEIGDNAVKNSYNAASALKGGLKLSNFSGSKNAIRGAIFSEPTTIKSEASPPQMSKIIAVA